MGRAFRFYARCYRFCYSFSTAPAARRRTSLVTVHDLAPELADLVQTAAAMTALDLVIGVDRGPINFAGALGVPLWVCLAANCHYRWGLEGSQTPWYPSAQLFRQPTAGDWAKRLRRGRCGPARPGGA